MQGNGWLRHEANWDKIILSQRNSRQDIMASARKYWVQAADHSDMSFQTPLEGTEEFFGPFLSYEDAFIAWHRVAWRWIDVCTHRARILSSE